MKNTLLTVVFAMATALTAQAQYTDIQINPIGALFANISATAEFPVKETIGIEPAVALIFGEQGLGIRDYKRAGFGVGVNAKFYFNPDDGHDKFYAGAYTRFNSIKYSSNESFQGYLDDYTRTRIALGFVAGYKWVADNGLVFELGLGGGRALLNNYDYDEGEDEFISLVDGLPQVDGYARLSIGYRLGSK